MPPTAVPGRRPSLPRAALLLAFAFLALPSPATLAGVPQAVDDEVLVELVPGTRLIDTTGKDPVLVKGRRSPRTSRR